MKLTIGVSVVARQTGKSLWLAAVAGLAALSVHSQPVDWLWAKRVGGPGEYEEGVAVARGAAGHCYVTGYYTSPTATIRGRTNSVILTNTDKGDNIFLAKYTPAGELVWAQGIRGITYPFILSSYVSVSGMALDASDNLYLTGYFYHYAVFGTTNAVTLYSPGNLDAFFLAKFASDGTLLWAQQGQGYVPASGTSVHLDDAGQVYVAGSFGDPYGMGFDDFTLGLGGDSITLPTTYQMSVFTAKFNPEGRLAWAQLAAKGDVGVYDLAADHCGNVYCSGYFSEVVMVGAGTNTVMLTNADWPVWRPFLAKFDSNGAFLRGGELGGRLAVGSDNSLYAASAFFADQTLGTGSNTAGLTNAGGADVCVAKYSPDGQLVWAKSSGGAGDDWPMDMAIDAADNIYLTGGFGDWAAGANAAEISFGEGESTVELRSVGTNRWNASAGDVFVASYSSSGGLNWAVRAGGEGLDVGVGVTADGSGGCYVAGFFTTGAGFGGGPGGITLTNDPAVPPSQDAFVARLGFVPRFTGLTRLTNGEVEIRATGSPDIEIELQASSTLRDWSPISSFSLTNGTISAKDPTATDFPNRFYRLISR